MISLVGLALAAFGTCTGLLWRWAPVAALDLRLFRAINAREDRRSVDRMVRLLRPLGTTWGLVLVAVGMFLLDPTGAVFLLLVAVASGLVERSLKMGIKRMRPYEILDGVQVRQNPPPPDPSFPSGDASRVCYLASALTFRFAWPAWAGAAVLGLALIVSLGRVRMGVHYPSDVWAGSWLGFGMGLMWLGLLPLFRGVWG